MDFCPKCGKEVTKHEPFCTHCGSSLAPKKRNRQEKEYFRERHTCFGEDERVEDPLGLVSFGFFLIITAVVFVANPSILSDLGSWLRQSVERQVLIRPSRTLVTSATLFFGLMAVSSFLVAGTRFMVSRFKIRILADLFSGLALSAFAYLTHLYGGYGLQWQTVLGMEAVICGLLIILYSLLRYVFLR